MSDRHTVFTDIRGIISDWLLNLALTVAPKDDKPALASAIHQYTTEIIFKYRPRPKMSRRFKP
jgi:hypothetical protein